MKMKKPGSRLGNSLPMNKKDMKSPMDPDAQMEGIEPVHGLAGRPANGANKPTIKSIEGLKALYKKKYSK